MFKVIAEYPDFIVIDKEAGINFHDEGKIGSGLHSQVKAHLINTQTPKESETELYPVHRLDKMTSGLVIFAKNLNSAQIFGELFSQHDIEKYYLAISDKKPSKKQGLIKGDMAKSRRGMYKLLRSQNNPAITQFFSYSIGNKKRLYLLKPHSGKTHQLRVALASIGAPIIGDTLYYPQEQNRVLDNDRGYLHAYALKFEYFNELFEFICPPSHGDHFVNASASEQFTNINEPWSIKWPKV